MEVCGGGLWKSEVAISISITFTWRWMRRSHERCVVFGVPPCQYIGGAYSGELNEAEPRLSRFALMH